MSTEAYPEREDEGKLNDYS